MASQDVHPRETTTSPRTVRTAKVSGILAQLVTVFLLFDGNPKNLNDPSFRAYGCNTSILLRPGPGGRIPVACTVWYDASADRESEYYVETAQPRLGQILMGCAFGFDRSKNRSDCVAPDFSQAQPTQGNRVEGQSDVEEAPEVEKVRDRESAPVHGIEAPSPRRPGRGVRRTPRDR